MKILALNLNSYQEDNQLIKFERIADEIVSNEIDVVCFCEASQRLTSANLPDYYVRDDNAIKVICDYVNKKSNEDYHFAWDFSHYGFKIYEEGIGIITKHPIKEVITRYVSKTHDVFTYKSRKIMRTTIDYLGEFIDVYSVQLGWIDDAQEPFKDQFIKLDEWVKESNLFSILAGDFSNDVTTNTYQQIIEAGYVDQYIHCNPDGLNDDTFINPEGWDYQNLKPLRLDYVFTNGLAYKAVDSKLFFPIEDRVSDHKAVYVELEKNKDI